MDYSYSNLKNKVDNSTMTNKTESKPQSLPNIIKNISFHFVKLNYNKYLEDNKMEEIADSKNNSKKKGWHITQDAYGLLRQLPQIDISMPYLHTHFNSNHTSHHSSNHSSNVGNSS